MQQQQFNNQQQYNNQQQNYNQPYQPYQNQYSQRPMMQPNQAPIPDWMNTPLEKPRRKPSGGLIGYIIFGLIVFGLTWFFKPKEEPSKLAESPKEPLIPERDTEKSIFASNLTTSRKPIVPLYDDEDKEGEEDEEDEEDEEEDKDKEYINHSTDRRFPSRLDADEIFEKKRREDLGDTSTEN